MTTGSDNLLSMSDFFLISERSQAYTAHVNCTMRLCGVFLIEDVITSTYDFRE